MNSSPSRELPFEPKTLREYPGRFIGLEAIDAQAVISIDSIRSNGIASSDLQLRVAVTRLDAGKAYWTDDIVSGLAADRVFAEALAQIEEIASLPENWDDEDGLPPTPVAVDVAKRLIRVLAFNVTGIPFELRQPYHIAPVADGGILFEWHSATKLLDVYIEPGGGLRSMLATGRPRYESFVANPRLALADIPVLIGALTRS